MSRLNSLTVLMLKQGAQGELLGKPFPFPFRKYDV